AWTDCRPNSVRPRPSLTWARITRSWKLGSAYVAMMPMIAITIISSISVKPSIFFMAASSYRRGEPEDRKIERDHEEPERNSDHDIRGDQHVGLELRQGRLELGIAPALDVGARSGHVPGPGSELQHRR